MSRGTTKEPLIIQAESEWRPERNPAGLGTEEHDMGNPSPRDCWTAEPIQETSFVTTSCQGPNLTVQDACL